MIPTSGAIYDISKYDRATYTSEQTNERLTQFRGNANPSKGNAQDSLIGVTAAEKADVLVTDDKRFQKRMQETAGDLVQVWSFEEFRQYLDSLLP